MKKIFAVLFVAGIMTACNDANTNQTQTDTVPATGTQAMPPGVDTTGADADTATTKPAGIGSSGH